MLLSLVKVTGTLPGGGKYTGEVVGGGGCMVVNPAEAPSGPGKKHSVDPGTHFVAILMPWCTRTAVPVYLINPVLPCL